MFLSARRRLVDRKYVNIAYLFEPGRGASPAWSDSRVSTIVAFAQRRIWFLK
jgi:hypothetical protein